MNVSIDYNDFSHGKKNADAVGSDFALFFFVPQCSVQYFVHSNQIKTFFFLNHL